MGNIYAFGELQIFDAQPSFKYLAERSLIVNFMITGFSILNVEGKIESAQSLAKQRFPKLNINIEKVEHKGEKVDINYSFLAEYMDGDSKESKKVGSIKLEGVVEMTEGKEASAAVIKKWDADHMLPTNMAEELINSLNFRCSATGTLVAYSIGLIPPMVVSTTKITEPKK